MIFSAPHSHLYKCIYHWQSCVVFLYVTLSIPSLLLFETNVLLRSHRGNDLFYTQMYLAKLTLCLGESIMSYRCLEYHKAHFGCFSSKITESFLS